MSLKSTVACLAAGVALGMLLAPEKGSQTRQKIGETFDDWKERWQRITGASGEELEELKEVFKHEIAGLRDDVRKRVLDILQATRAAKNHVKEEMAS